MHCWDCFTKLYNFSEVVEREEVKSAKVAPEASPVEQSGGLTGLLGAYSSSDDSDSDNT